MLRGLKLILSVQPRPGTLLGATNPLILSAARHYPHIIRLSPPPKPADSPAQGVFGSVSKATASHSFKEAQSTSHGVFSERKRHIKKDTSALKAAEEKLKARDCKSLLIRTESACELTMNSHRQRCCSRCYSATMYEHSYRTLSSTFESVLRDSPASRLVRSFTKGALGRLADVFCLHSQVGWYVYAKADSDL